MVWQMGSVFIIICSAMFSQVIDGYILSAPRDAIVLLDGRVELDCIANSSYPAVWRYTPYGSGEDEWISRGNGTRKNISDSFRILHEDIGQFSLVIDPVLTSLAGRYECQDKDQAISAEVTVLDEIPSCNESTASLARKIVCKFGYAGNRKPEFQWMTQRYSSWKALCHTSKDTVDCVFESSCTVHKQSVNANTFLTICLGGNSTCEWGNTSSNVGLLRIMDYNKTVGSWHCSSAEVATTTSSNSNQEPINSPRICRKKGAAHDVLYDRAMDQVDPTQTQTETITVVNGYLASEPENSPVYAQVQKKRKAQPRTTVIGHDTLVFDNVLYASSKTSGAAKTPSEVSKNNFATDGIIYADLRQVPRETSSRTQRTPMVIREGFDTSTYAFIDHSLRAPALLPK